MYLRFYALTFMFKIFNSIPIQYMFIWKLIALFVNTICVWDETFMSNEHCSKNEKNFRIKTLFYRYRPFLQIHPRIFSREFYWIIRCFCRKTESPGSGSVFLWMKSGSRWPTLYEFNRIRFEFKTQICNCLTNSWLCAGDLSRVPGMNPLNLHLELFAQRDIGKGKQLKI